MQDTKRQQLYSSVVSDAIERLIADYESGKIELFSEADLQSHLFFYCRHIMESRSFPKPLKLYAEKAFLEKNKKVDLVLGDKDVLIELKFEGNYPGVSKPVVFTWKREAGSSGSIELDVEKITAYSQHGKISHFLMIDEDGMHRRKYPGPWRTIEKKQAHLLHLTMNLQ